jgi:hypothetical protein
VERRSYLPLLAVKLLDVHADDATEQLVELMEARQMLHLGEGGPGLLDQDDELLGAHILSVSEVTHDADGAPAFAGRFRLLQLSSHRVLKRYPGRLGESGGRQQSDGLR